MKLYFLRHSFNNDFQICWGHTSAFSQIYQFRGTIGFVAVIRKGFGGITKILTKYMNNWMKLLPATSTAFLFYVPSDHSLPILCKCAQFSVNYRKMGLLQLQNVSGRNESKKERGKKKHLCPTYLHVKFAWGANEKQVVECKTVRLRPAF